MVVVTAAGIFSVPVLYGLNKQRRNLGLEPYAYCSVLESIFKLFEILAAKVSSIKTDDSCSFRDLDEKRIQEIVRDWDERDSIESRVQFFVERQTDEERVTESEVCWDAENEGKIANDVEQLSNKGNVTPETRCHALLEIEAPNKENRDVVSKWCDTQCRLFLKSVANEVPPKDVRNCSEETRSTLDYHVQIISHDTKNEGEIVQNVKDCEEERLCTRGMSLNENCAPVSLAEKEANKGTVEDVGDKDEGTLNSQEDGGKVHMTKKTGKRIQRRVKGRGRRKKTMHKARDNACVETATAEGTVQDVLSPNEKNVFKDTMHIEISKAKETDENKNECQEKIVSTQNASVQVHIETEIGKDTMVDYKTSEEENAVTSCKTSVRGLVKKENEEGSKESVGIRDKERQSGSQVISWLETTVESNELQPHEEPGSNVPILPTAVSYFDESQVSNQLDDNTIAILQDILGTGEKSKDAMEIDDQLSAEEGCKTGALQFTSGRQALSDEENVYGRQDIQCTAPKRTTSDAFHYANKSDETFPNSDKRREFVRFRDHLPFTRHSKHHSEVDQIEKAWDQAEYGTVTGTQVQETEKDCEGQEVEGIPENEPKKGKRRRKRRGNNKRITLENRTGFAGNEADDELDKQDLEQGATGTTEKDKHDQKNAEKATHLQYNTTTSDQKNEQKQTTTADLQCQTMTSNKDKEPAEAELDKINKAVNDANVPPEKVAKNRDKAKKGLAEKMFVTSEKRKGGIFRFLSRKNTSNPKHCDVREKNTTGPTKSDFDAVVRHDLKDCDARKKNTTDTKDCQMTKKCAADLKKCHVSKNIADPKGCDVRKNDPSKQSTVHTQDGNDQKKSNLSVSRSPSASSARSSKVAAVGSDQKKSNVTVRRSVSLSSARSLKAAGADGGSAAKMASGAYAAAEEENDCEAVLSLYDDID